MSGTQPLNAPSPVRWLVPRARRSIPLGPALLLVPLGVAYATLAYLNPLLRTSPIAVLVLTTLFLLTAAFAVAAPNGDLLEPRRVVSFYFCIIFCVAPLADNAVTWHYKGHLPDLIAASALFAFGAYALTMIGYHLPLFRVPLPVAVEARQEGLSPRIGAWLGLFLFGIGVGAWIFLFIRVGGLSGLIYSEEGRSTFFQGFGYLFWFAAFMFPGTTLYFASRVTRRPRLAWIYALPSVVSFGFFLVLQGRMRALNIVILAMFVSHYLVRPLRFWKVAVFGVLGLALSLFVGFARAPSVRSSIFQPSVLVAQISTELEPVVRGFIVGDLSRLRQLALILGKVPSVMPFDWGRSFAMFLNPWFRLLGFDDLQREGIGPRLFRLAHPDAGIVETGYLPSILGEMLFNFPWYLAVWLFIFYGLAMRLFYQRLILTRGDFVSVALYGVLVLFTANMLLQSFGHVIFELLILTLPLILARTICKFGGTNPARAVKRQRGSSAIAAGEHI